MDSNTKSPRAFPAILGSLALVTCILYFALGILYATKLTPSTKVSLALKDDMFLQAFQTWGMVHESDSALINRTAVEILKTGVPRTISGALYFHAPAYSYFLAACYAVGGVRLLSVAVPQAVLGGLICLLLALTARRLAPHYQQLAALFTAILVLVNVRLAMYVGYVNPTIPLMFLLALALWGSTRLETVWGIALFTVGMVLGTYTQAAFFVVAVAAAAWLLARSRKIKSGAALVGALCIVGFAILKVALGLLDRPAANYDFQHEAGRSMMWFANNPQYDYMTWRSWWEWQGKQPPTEEQMSRYNEYLARANNRPMHATWLWISENPARYATLCVVRLKSELGPFTGQMSPRNRKVSSVIWLLIFPAGYYGLWKYRHHELTHLAIMIVLAVTAFGTFVIEELYLRYRLPVDLVLTLFAGVAYSDLVSRFCRASLSNAVATQL